MGTIVGLSDTDPLKWPRSKWRCLQVEWDEPGCGDKQSRVSPWEIETLFPSLTAGLKRPFHSAFFGAQSEWDSMMTRPFIGVPGNTYDPSNDIALLHQHDASFSMHTTPWMMHANLETQFLPGQQVNAFQSELASANGFLPYPNDGNLSPKSFHSLSGLLRPAGPSSVTGSETLNPLLPTMNPAIYGYKYKKQGVNVKERVNLITDGTPQKAVDQMVEKEDEWADQTLYLDQQAGPSWVNEVMEPSNRIVTEQVQMDGFGPNLFGPE